MQEESNATSSAGVIGVLGGMGPLATIDFMHKLLDATPAATDQDHVPIVVSSIPQVPDRTAAFKGEGDSPLKAMIASGQRLAGAGAELLVIPCNTAHLWFNEIADALKLPMLHLVDSALEATADLIGPKARVGLLATDATIASGLYINRARSLALAREMEWVLPTASEMLELVMPGISAVKAGDLQRGEQLLGHCGRALAQRGAQALVLGCTEIPVVLTPERVPVPVVDATAALARRAVAWSLAKRSPAAAASAS